MRKARMSNLGVASEQEPSSIRGFLVAIAVGFSEIRYVPIDAVPMLPSCTVQKKLPACLHPAHD